MIPEIISNRDIPVAQQFDACRSWFSSAFEITNPNDPAEGFLSESRYWPLDGLAVAQVGAPAVRNTRTSTLVHRNPIDHWVLTVGQQPTGISTAASSVLIPAQTPFLVSMAQSFASERAADERLQFYLPRDTFADLAGQLDAACWLGLETGLGRLLRDFLRGVMRSLAEAQPSDLPHVTAAVRAMVGACVVPSKDRLAEASGLIGATRLDRIRRAIRQHLDSPDLGAARLCALVGVSRSELYRLLQSEGGVGRYIQRQRLLRCRELLGDISNTASIGAVAASVGFDDPSQFSRSFKREFGLSPTDLRAMALENLSLPRAEAAFPSLGAKLSAIMQRPH
ncbi:helix-turn-helix domain-containing protein [Roseococcus pinisoli]|uniref:Helix-turn-helix transcriptional regulator n=1 Tax=Roseococcus pinisoli TaxID=2835040 RepID=A0ABS5QJ52_9PROT|nr:AraC family transcriptional regulator [Roseococcus pinisoli]MBS7813602.1 helix-turn-helix transcriptional regulator [Roseococcus pinisoli]